MSLAFQSMDDVRNLVERLGVKVTSLDELEQLLTTIMEKSDPDMARNRAVKHIALMGVGIPSACALGFSFILLMMSMNRYVDFPVGFYIASFGIVWGVAGLISLMSLIFALVSFSQRRPFPPPQPYNYVPIERPSPMIRREDVP